MGSFEHLRDVQPEPATYTVPTEKMRQGDFSEFTNQIFDPRDGDQRRRPHRRSPNNHDPGGPHQSGRRAPTRRCIRCRTGPAPSATTSPTSCGPTTTTPGWGASITTSTRHNRLFVTGYWNKRQEDRYNWAQDATNATDGGVINGFAVTKGFDYRTNTGVTAGYTVGDARRRCCSTCARSWARFGE